MSVAIRALLGGARGRALAGWLAVLVVLAWLHAGAVFRNVGRTVGTSLINGDAQAQIVPFFKYFASTSSAFSHDYVADYYLACYPLGYYGLYAGAARLGIDPTVLSRYLPHALWLIAVVCLGAAASRFGGKLAALAAMSLALGSNIYLYRIGGGLPRSFGFPILAATLLCLVSGRVWWCAVCVVLGALFYPVAAVISGLALASVVLFARFVGSSASSWSFFRRLVFLGGIAAIAGALLLPSAVSSSRFGRLVRPDDVHEFPEAGVGGRFDPNSRPPFRGYFASVPTAVAQALPHGSRAARLLLRPGKRQVTTAGGLKGGLLVLAMVGGLGLLVRRGAARRALLLGVAAGVGYTMARFAAPYAYLPERYVGYTVAPLTALLLSTCVAGLFPPSFDVRRRRVWKTIAMAASAAALLFFFGGSVSPTVGTTIDLRKNEVILDRIAALPAETLVAGWPKGMMDRVPFVARRRALVTFETHQAFHDGYMREMRRRMRALLDAYFATSVEPIVLLREEFGVTHLLVDKTDLDARPRQYFRPFNQWVWTLRVAARGKSFELPRQFRRAAVISYKDLVLLDLSRIEPDAPADTSPGRLAPPSAGSERRRSSP